MSKYIRTKKYGICEITHEDKRTIHYENSLVSGCLWKDDVEYQIADTIEELCDEVCCDNKVQLLVNIYTNETKAQMIRNTVEQLFYKGKKDVYGAIWTDKGLIFVACMNDKGELELL